MKKIWMIAGAIMLAACGGGNDESDTQETDILFSGPAETIMGLKNPASFTAIEDETEQSTALFGEMYKVISSPRCMNCHPRSDIPTQGDDMRLHVPPVERGPSGFGEVGMECGTCHGAENFVYAGADGSIPGHEHWHLAPLSMGWVGMTVGEVCDQLKDPARNGDRTLEAIHEHNATDGLVAWGWEPGEGRTPAPGNQEVFGALTEAWIATGAHCPAS